MPHECTSCGKVFADGSKEMLSGCPDCGGNKFQFRPGSAPDRTPATDRADAGAAAEPAGVDPDAVADDQSGGGSPPRADDSAGGESRRSVKEWIGLGSDDESADPAAAESGPQSPSTREASSTTPASESPPRSDRESTPDPETTGELPPASEDRAQADARSSVVSPDELAAAAEDVRTPNDRPDVDGRVIEPSSDERPDLDELREELNDQFESIKIVSPGKYELNLMELYDRSEYIISLQEDGRYVIEVPDTWRERSED